MLWHKFCILKVRWRVINCIYFRTIEYMDKGDCRHLRRCCAKHSLTEGLFQRQLLKTLDPGNSGINRKGYELGGQVGVIIKPKLIGCMIQAKGMVDFLT